MTSDNEIKGSWKAEWGGKIAGWLIRLLGMTLRVETKGWQDQFADDSEQFVHVLWHNQVCAGPYIWRGLYPQRDCVVLTSASKDGAALAAAMKVFKVGSVRGSSSRRGAAALIALKKAAKEGADLVVTPDGPRGPRYHLQAGVIKLAQTTGLKMIPMHFHYHSSWTLKTWDRFRIPKPFSKVTLELREVLEVPRKLTEDEFEAKRLTLETCLREGITDLLEEDDTNH